jgi:4-hydroxy-tetrahydrodipicolinate synthase
MDGEMERRATARNMAEVAVAVFSGVGVALVTIFDQAGEVDERATAALAASLASRGMRAVLVNGTTGEAGTLNADERVRLIRAVRDLVPPEIPVLAGTGAATEAEAVVRTEAAAEAGADAILAYPPPGAEEVSGFFAAVVKAAAARPVLAYHVPWVSAPGVPVEALPDLPVEGIKDSSGSADRLLDELSSYGGAVYVGSSALLALAGPMGGAGAILALANVEPEACCRAFAGDAAAQRDLAAAHLRVRAGGPAELKRMLARGHGYSPVSRIA